MSLEHQFSIKEKKEVVYVPDDFLTYINDSLHWITSLWNGKTIKNGLPYYGEATIEGDEIDKLKKILSQWRELFSLANEKVQLTGNYLAEEMEYEKIIYSKDELLGIIDRLIQLCSKAEMMNTCIFFEGI